jgi:SAM-dependent methyltransferase
VTIKQKVQKNEVKPKELSHNRKKRYILEEGTAIPFLVDLGVQTKEGKIVNSRYDKFRQINRFLEFIQDIVEALPKGRELTIVDFGCGKSYLTFAMYHYLKVMKGFDIRVIGLDLKEDVIAYCNELKEKYGYDKMSFTTGDIKNYTGVDAVDMVVTLHACDTATDYALEKAVKWGASVILSVPCCQHELNYQMKNEELNTVFKYGLLKERIAALVTDGLRAEMLEQCGYDTQVLEFIDMEHTPKNILIRAVKRNKETKPDFEKYDNCCKALGVDPMLGRLLKK